MGTLISSSFKLIKERKTLKLQHKVSRKPPKNSTQFYEYDHFLCLLDKSMLYPGKFCYKLHYSGITNHLFPDKWLMKGGTNLGKMIFYLKTGALTDLR